MSNVLSSLLLLLACLVAALLLHALWSRAAKAVVAAAWPLSGHAHEAVAYERLVYHTAEAEPRRVVGLALASGAIAWVAVSSGWTLAWLPALAVLVAAVVLDVKTWQRVAGNADALWIQRGRGAPVERLDIEAISDLTVDEEEGDGRTLRNLLPGRRNLLCRLRVRMVDKQVVTLPWTDAARSLDAVEAMANHVRLRKQQAADRQAMQRAERSADEAVHAGRGRSTEIDRELADELARLRRRSLDPEAPPSIHATRESR